MSDQEIKKHYEELYMEHGASPKSVQWSSTASQVKRFEVLTSFLEKDASIIDLGCGLADLLSYLRSKGYVGRYLGLDLVQGFIDQARLKYAEDDSAKFMALAEGSLDYPSGFDYVLISGLFNNRRENNLGFMHSVLRSSFECASNGVVFNALSTRVDYMEDHLFYIDPIETFEFSKNDLNGHPVIRHDYTLTPGGFPYEFSICIRKKLA